MCNQPNHWQEIFLDEGAAAIGCVSATDWIPYENERMQARRLQSDFAVVSAVVAAFPYYVKGENAAVQNAAVQNAANLKARIESANGTVPPNDATPATDDLPRKVLPLYARGKDYVACNKARLARVAERLQSLFPENRFRPTGNGWPLPIVQAGRLAGLGNIGLHGLLILPEYGSCVTLGAVVTDLPLPTGTPAGTCELCGLCVDACPTGAIRWDGTTRSFDKTRCRSWLSEQKALTPEQEALLRGSPYALGCDDCQNVCPHNQNPRPTRLPEYGEDLLYSLSEAEALALTPDRKPYKLREQCVRNIRLG